MKKLIAAVGIVLSISTSAHALISVNYIDSSGWVMPDGTTPIISAGVGSDALVQLIFTPSNTHGQAYINGGVESYEQVLSERTFNFGDTGNEYLASFSENYVGSDLVGNLYIRIFQGDTAVGAVAVNQWYANGWLLPTVVNPGPPNTPDTVDFGPLLGGDGDFGTYRLNQQVIVPEPTTLALAALGVLGVVARRFRRS